MISKKVLLKGQHNLSFRIMNTFSQKAMKKDKVWKLNLKESRWVNSKSKVRINKNPEKAFLADFFVNNESFKLKNLHTSQFYKDSNQMTDKNDFSQNCLFLMDNNFFNKS